MAVQTLRPNAVYGAYQLSRSGAASNHAAVDDTTANGDTDYVYAQETFGGGVIELTDRYNLSAWAGDVSAVDVTVVVVCKGSGVGVVEECDFGLNIGGIDYLVPADLAPYGTYVTRSNVWALNPATGKPFTKVEMGALVGVLRFRAQSPGEPLVSWVRGTQLYVVGTELANVSISTGGIQRGRTLNASVLAQGPADRDLGGYDLITDLSFALEVGGRGVATPDAVLQTDLSYAMDLTAQPGDVVLSTDLGPALILEVEAP